MVDLAQEQTPAGPSGRGQPTVLSSQSEADPPAPSGRSELGGWMGGPRGTQLLKKQTTPYGLGRGWGGPALTCIHSKGGGDLSHRSCATCPQEKEESRPPRDKGPGQTWHPVTIPPTLASFPRTRAPAAG